jgi:hypothetical protein
MIQAPKPEPQIMSHELSEGHQQLLILVWLWIWRSYEMTRGNADRNVKSAALATCEWGAAAMARIVDLTLPVVTGMAGIPKIPLYEQYPVKVQAVTIVDEDQRGRLARECVDVMADAPAVGHPYRDPYRRAPAFSGGR